MEFAQRRQENRGKDDGPERISRDHNCVSRKGAIALTKQSAKKKVNDQCHADTESKKKYKGQW